MKKLFIIILAVILLIGSFSISFASVRKGDGNGYKYVNVIDKYWTGEVMECYLYDEDAEDGLKASETWFLPEMLIDHGDYISCTIVENIDKSDKEIQFEINKDKYSKDNLRLISMIINKNKEYKFLGVYHYNVKNGKLKKVPVEFMVKSEPWKKQDELNGRFKNAVECVYAFYECNKL